MSIQSAFLLITSVMTGPFGSRPLSRSCVRALRLRIESGRKWPRVFDLPLGDRCFDPRSFTGFTTRNLARHRTSSWTELHYERPMSFGGATAGILQVRCASSCRSQGP